MTKEELLGQLDQEIEQTAASVRFWRKQEELQAPTHYAALVSATADSYEAQLGHLQATRREIANP